MLFKKVRSELACLVISFEMMPNFSGGDSTSLNCNCSVSDGHLNQLNYQLTTTSPEDLDVNNVYRVKTELHKQGPKA